jgi:hypothetical protein
VVCGSEHGIAVDASSYAPVLKGSNDRFGGNVPWGTRGERAAAETTRRAVENPNAFLVRSEHIVDSPAACVMEM